MGNPRGPRCHADERDPQVQAYDDEDDQEQHPAAEGGLLLSLASRLGWPCRHLESAACLFLFSSASAHNDAQLRGTPSVFGQRSALLTVTSPYPASASFCCAWSRMIPRDRVPRPVAQMSELTSTTWPFLTALSWPQTGLLARSFEIGVGGSGVTWMVSTKMTWGLVLRICSSE